MKISNLKRIFKKDELNNYQYLIEKDKTSKTNIVSKGIFRDIVSTTNNVFNKISSKVKTHFETRIYPKKHKREWNNKIQYQKSIYMNKDTNNILKITDKESKKIENNIMVFNFDTKNIIYIDGIINDFKLIEHPSYELQRKYNEIVEYRNNLINQNNLEVEKKIREIENPFNKDSIRQNNTTIYTVEESVKKISKMLSNEKTKNISSDVKKVDINNYGNMDYLNVINYHKNPNINMKFSKAISIVRDKKLHTEDEWRTAVSVLSSTFGNSKEKKNNNEKKLNDFNKTEKLLSFYGRKIKNNIATNEEKLIYNALIYHLTMFDMDSFSIDDIEDYVNDYMIEEADRYIEDVKKYQKIF